MIIKFIVGGPVGPVLVTNLSILVEGKLNVRDQCNQSQLVVGVI